MHPEDLSLRYPEVERPWRGDGSEEAREKCLKPIREKAERILAIVEGIAEMKGLSYEEVFAFQSRVMGTCKEGSDIDAYIRLSESHRSMVMEYGVLYKDTGIKVICDEWATKFFKDSYEAFKEELATLKVDLFWGVEETPPAKAEYRGQRYYISLQELAEANQR